MNTRNVYSIVNIRDGRTDSEEIIQVFSDMAAGKIPCDLKLLNYYREIPVSYNARVVNVTRDRVEFKIHQNQALVMKLDKHTLIKSSHFHKNLGVHCFSAYTNVNKEVAILTRFAYAQIKAERRSAVRVTVSPALSVVFTGSESEISGSILDISTNGLSVVTNKEPAAGENLQGTLSFVIAGNRLELESVLLKSVETNDGYLCVFQYALKGVQEKAISQYIYSRQVEIIRELKEQL